MRSVAFVVFIFPVVISLFFGTYVITDVLKEPNRELKMLNFEFPEGLDFQTESIKISGLLKEYSKSDTIEIKVSILDPIFDCGDLYITIYDLSSSPKQVFTQSGYFEQCFGKNNLLLPIEDEFSEIVNISGQYEILIEMKDKSYKRSVAANEMFRVK
ncbi:MAG: hypothetical protein O6746_05435 [Thaumarchaeota archaeon]|nr:hypothetical protein [Nitrososphaerota archaeon]